MDIRETEEKVKLASSISTPRRDSGCTDRVHPRAILATSLRITGVSLLILVATIVSAAFADTDTDTEAPKIAKPALANESPSPAFAPIAPIKPRIPENRYTTRKRIEKMRPNRWLRKYGSVEVSRPPAAKPKSPSPPASAP